MKLTLRASSLSFCLLFAAAGCDSSEPAQTLDDLFVPLAPAASQNLCQTTSRVPSTNAGNALLWTLDTLNLFPDQGSENALLDRFDSSVFDTASASALAASLRTIGSSRPFALAGFAELPTDSSLHAVLASATAGYLAVSLETASNGKMTVLHFEPFTPPAEAPDCPEPADEPAAAAAPANTAPANTPPATAPGTVDPAAANLPNTANNTAPNTANNTAPNTANNTAPNTANTGGQ